MPASWPVIWPEGATEGIDPEVVARAEEMAATTLRMLTLEQVGGVPITVMPCGSGCRKPRYSVFHPILLETGRYANCWCSDGCGCITEPTVTLVGPVGRIDEVQINGEIVPATAYELWDGDKLVRIDGGRWPVCAGRNFTVTYLNGYEVDQMGQFIAGVLAMEYIKAATGDSKNKCRLPSSVTSLTRQGVSMTIAPGLFPNNQTGITEVDLYVRQWNPNGLKVANAIYSPDSPHQRQVIR